MQDRQLMRGLIWRHVRESVRHYGWRRTGDQLANALYQVVREMFPDRRKARFGDLDFDMEHEVDTTRASVRWTTQLKLGLAGHCYFPTEPWLFEQIMEAMPIEHRQFTFVDLGSGKGRVVLMAAAHPFKQIVGVEFLRELHEIAERNVSRLAGGRGQCGDIRLVCGDAREFVFPGGDLVIYLFNPFPAPEVALILKRLEESVRKEPRTVYVAYRYPESEHLLAACRWLRKAAGTKQWSVYRTLPR